MNTAQTLFPPPDFRVLFESAPGCYLVLLPDLTITAVTDAYLRATMTQREDILGRGLFDVFPDNPQDPTATGASNLRASLQRVLKNKVADTMAVQKYDIRQPQSEGGGFEERHWSPVNSPVFGPDGNIVYIIHRVEDVTEFVRLKQRGLEQHKATEQMEMEILTRARELHNANQRLRDSQIFLDSILDNLPNMVFVKEAHDLRFVYFNKAGEKLLGHARADLLGKNDHDFFPKEQADLFIGQDRNVLKCGELVEIADEAIQTHHQGMRYLHTKKLPILNSDGVATYLLGISEDITERKRAEEEIRMLNATLEKNVHELERTNKELESFSYSVSHDLRAPLRGINGYAHILLEDYHQLSDLEREEYLKKIDAATIKMALLIDGLLNLCHLTRQDIHRVPTDLSEIARGIIQGLREREPRLVTTVVIQDSLVVRADPALLQAAMQNLLHNAWKFSSKTDHPHIEVGRLSSTETNKEAYFIRDNGAGFDMAYKNKLFGAFQRLHTDGEFQGTGIGLATVQRIIHRHGGQLWAHAEVGKGAAFYFTLD